MFITDLPTEDRILISAEKLFAEIGFHAVSIRAVAARAEVNVAAVNYHFYDLESLLKEILVRRLRAVNSIRLAALGEAEARSRPARAEAPEVLRIMALPLLVSSENPIEYNAHSRRLLGRLLLEPFPNRGDILTGEFEPAMARFAQVLRRDVLSVAPVDFMWRFSLIVGALHHSLSTLHEMASLTRGLCANDDHQTALATFVRSGVCILRA